MIRLLMIHVFLYIGSTDGQDIRNPTKTDAAKYQWLVAIVGYSRQNDLFICTGAALSKTLILSSAWCLEQMPGMIILFLVGFKEILIRGELSLFSGKAVETFQRPKNLTVKDSTLYDSLDVLGCLKDLIYHPCYSKVEQCTNTRCERVSWKCDLVVLETIEDMKTGVTVIDTNFLDWKEEERKDCVFRGFDYARMYVKNKEVDQFYLVESNMKAGRGQLPCKMGQSLTERVIWSEDRFVGSFRFLSMSGGYLTCSNQTAGIFLGKLDIEECTVGNQYKPKSTTKFRMSWTYLLPHKGWIENVISDPSKFLVENRNEDTSAFPNPRISKSLIWFALGLSVNWNYVEVIFEFTNVISRGHF